MSSHILFGLISVTTAVVAFVAAFMVLQRWSQRRRTYLLFWGIGLVFYGIGAAMEAYFTLAGWNAFVFRLWYLTGAFFTAAYLGQGTAFMLLPRRWASLLFAILAVGSVYAIFKVFTATLDPSLLTGSEMSGKIIVSPGVRILTPFFNIYGTLLLVGGAIYSAWLFWRKRVLLNRVLGNILIAAGGLFPAFGGAFQRAGVPGILYFSELIGVILIFVGYLFATSEAAKAAAPRAVGGTSSS